MIDWASVLLGYVVGLFFALLLHYRIVRRSARATLFELDNMRAEQQRLVRESKQREETYNDIIRRLDRMGPIDEYHGKVRSKLS